MLQENLYSITTKFDARCKRCSLTTGRAIGGHSFSPLSKLGLFIISAYPGAEEVKQGFSLAPNTQSPTMDTMNAGRYLRYALTHVFDLDPSFPSSLKPFYKYCAYSNIVKCSPIIRKEKKDVSEQHIKVCKDWLELEVEELSKHNPKIPLLLLGSEACKLIDKDLTVYSNRRKLFHYKNLNPTIISFNPIECVRYSHRTLKDFKTRLDGTLKVEDIGYWKPLPFGSVPWHFLKDLELIKKYVLNHYYYHLNKVN